MFDKEAEQEIQLPDVDREAKKKRPFHLQHHDFIFILRMTTNLRERIIPLLKEIEDMSPEESELLEELITADPELKHMQWKCNVILRKMEEKKRLQEAGMIR